MIDGAGMRLVSRSLTCPNLLELRWGRFSGRATKQIEARFPQRYAAGNGLSVNRSRWWS